MMISEPPNNREEPKRTTKQIAYNRLVDIRMECISKLDTLLQLDGIANKKIGNDSPADDRVGMIKVCDSKFAAQVRWLAKLKKIRS